MTFRRGFSRRADGLRNFFKTPIRSDRNSLPKPKSGELPVLFGAGRKDLTRQHLFIGVRLFYGRVVAIGRERTLVLAGER
jgi:hypothetical protein